MRFLTGSMIQTQVKMIARGTDALMAAVAYWGTGAAERTGLTRSKKPQNVRVISTCSAERAIRRRSRD